MENEEELKKQADLEYSRRYYREHAKVISEKQKARYQNNIEFNRERAVRYYRNKVGVVRPRGRPPKYTEAPEEPFTTLGGPLRSKEPFTTPQSSVPTRGPVRPRKHAISPNNDFGAQNDNAVCEEANAV
jgi:hypothetical protein